MGFGDFFKESNEYADYHRNDGKYREPCCPRCGSENIRTPGCTSNDIDWKGWAECLDCGRGISEREYRRFE